MSDSTKLEYRHIKDPIHGSTELHPLLYAIINTPEFHRLKFIRQLGGGFYVYPGATHTRFEHSIGVCYLAGQFARMLKEKQPELGITSTDVLTVEVAGLCHDLGHGPFSHEFDSKVLKSIDKKTKLEHEKRSQMIVQRIFDERLQNKYGVNPETVKAMIDYEEKEIPKHRKFLYQIVANKTNGIDVDKWDYFIRDCHYLGLRHEFDYRRLMQLSRVVEVTKGENIICYHEKEADNILGMFRTRCSLFKKAYGHKTVVAFEHMISSALLEVKEVGFLRVPGHDGDMSLVEIVTDLKNKKLDGFLTLTDDIIGIIKARNLPDLDEVCRAQKLFDQVAKRDIPHRKVVIAISKDKWKTLTKEKKKEIEDEVKKTEDEVKKTLKRTGDEAKKPDDEEKKKGDVRQASAFIHFADFSYQSESKGSDPYTKVHFYSKQDSDKARILDEGEKPEVFVPKNWGEKAVWIYTVGDFPEDKVKEMKKKIEDLLGIQSE